MDDKSKKAPQDSSKVNLSEDYEVQYWTEKFHCSREELEKAVKAVGTSAEAVEKHLKHQTVS